MSTAPPPPPPLEERRQPFQFSMATLMGTITLIAVGLGLLMTLPLWVGVLALSIVEVGIVSFLLAGALFAEDGKRTFCIGAIAVYVFGLFHAPIYVVMGSTFQYSSTMQVIANIVGQLVSALLGGSFCLLARRFWESPTS